MPTYQYQCTACQEGLEVVQKFTDDSLTECPRCEGRLKKVFTAVGVVFKGSGFYRNDSRSAPSSGSESSSGSEASSSSGEKSNSATKKEKSGSSTSDTKSGSGSASSTPKSAGASSAA